MADPKPASRVHPVSRETRFLRLRSLRCYKEVHERVVQGWTPSEIARFIQDERSEYGDVTRGSLITLLNDYRNSIPRAELIAKRMPTVFNKAAEDVRQGLDALQELEKLYEIQRSRINIDAGTEKKINKLMPSMTQEIKVASEILAKYAQLQMDLGLMDRHLGKMEVDAVVVADVAGRYGSPAIGQVMQDPESRRRVLGLAQRLLQANSVLTDADVIEGDIRSADVKVEEVSGDPRPEHVSDAAVPLPVAPTDPLVSGAAR